MEVVKAFTSNNLHTEITIKGTHEKPLFRASDIGTVLEIANIRSNLQELSETEKVVVLTDTIRGIQSVTYITAKGLYKILFRSRKPIAEQFQNWICDVIEEIRLTGEYNLQNELKLAKEKTEEAKKRIEELEKQNESLSDEKIPSIYIYNVDTRLSPPELKIGYTLNVQTRIRPYKQVCKHGRLEFSHQVYNKNIKVFENFIHNMLSDFLVKDEVFRIEVDEAKLILLGMVNRINLLKIQSPTERQSKLRKLLDYENLIINNHESKTSTMSIGTQTDVDDKNIELTNSFVDEKNELTQKFNQYIDECCIVRHDAEVYSGDIEGRFRLWSKIIKQDVTQALNNYLKTRFRYARITNQDKNQLLYGYIGVTLKEIEYKKLLVNSDEQDFIYHSCVFSPSGKVLNSDLIEEYSKWKRTLNKRETDADASNLKKYLSYTGYAIFTTLWAFGGSGQGYYGISLKNQTNNVKKTSSTGKKVEKRLIESDQLIGTWETIAKAADSEKICAAKMSRSIKNKILYNNEYYYCLSTK
jgi:prophage antirepressor-like protein